MKVSMAEFKRRLPPKTEFTAEHIGRYNGRHGRPGLRVTRRRVLKYEKNNLVSVVLDGPDVGVEVDLFLGGVTIEETEGLFLTNTKVTPPDTFLKITIGPDPKKVTADEAEGGTFTLHLWQTKIRGLECAAASCVVSLGTADIPAIAVKVNDRKHVNDREAAERWLVSSGLTEAEAKYLIDAALRRERQEDRRRARLLKTGILRSNLSDAAQGEYWEEVEKIVDGTVEGIGAGEVVQRRGARARARHACHQSVYARDEDLAVIVLWYSDHPSAGIASIPPGVDADAFPFLAVAKAAMREDAEEELKHRLEYLALEE
jgi:uncharacterized protein YoaH (UPF0181 family)